MHRYSQVWVVDFEFTAPPGCNPSPICLVAKELRSGRVLRFAQCNLEALPHAPYDTGPSALFVAFYASAEIGCHLALGWRLPVNVLDLYIEFKNHTNGLLRPLGAGLLGALAYFGLGAIEAAEKADMRELAMRGGPYTAEEMSALLNYCQSDVESLERLHGRMLPHIDLERALLRGRYMAAAAHIERNGVPVDVGMLDLLRGHWGHIQDALIAEIDKDYGIFDGRTFKRGRFERWLATNHIPWPLLSSGQLDLRDNTFREMARSHPQIAPLRELRAALSEMRLNDLAVGPDSRNRTLLSAFSSRTSRNQPSNTRFAFGPAVWLRGLIKPPPGSALAYVDWSQQEFGVAAALSGDQAMQSAYLSGDPYLEFAKQAGAVPPSATKKTHGAEREQFKACALAVQYGMQSQSLAQRIGKTPAHAAELLRLHHDTYREFWRWSDRVQDHAFLCGQLHTVFGWALQTSDTSKPRSIRNFPMQANGAEMLRLACMMGIEAGIRIAAPIHDAVLIEAPADEIDDHVTTMQALMEKASMVVLGGFRLRSDVKTVCFPNRYMDVRGERMWHTVMRLLPPADSGGHDGTPQSLCDVP